MPTDHIEYVIRKPSFSDWVKHYQAKGCGYSKALKCASRKIRRG